MKTLRLVLIAVMVVSFLIIIPDHTRLAFALCAVSEWGIGGGGASPIYDPQPQHIGDKDLDVEIRILQNPYEGNYSSTVRSIQFRLCDTNGDNTILHTTYKITVTKEDNHEIVLDKIFHSHSGLLLLKIQNSSTTLIPEINQDPYLDNALVADSNGTISMKGPFLWQPGAYDIKVKILGYDKDRLVYENNAPVFKYTTDVPDILWEMISHGKESYKVKIFSTEKIQDFNYDPLTMRLAWSVHVPKEDILESTHQIFSHAEIPKSFYEFARSPFLNMTVNDILVLGPYVDLQSSHIDILSDFLFSDSFLSNLAEHQNSSIASLTFSISPVTTSSSHFVMNNGVWALVSWNPYPPVANVNSTANIKFFNSNGMPLKNVVYDVYVYHKPGEYFEGKDMIIAKNGTDSEKLFFPKNGVYGIYLHVRGLSNSSAARSIDNTLDGDSFGYVVVVPEFPIAIPVLLIGIVSAIVFYRVKLVK